MSYQTMADPWTRKRSIKYRVRLDVFEDGEWHCVCSAFGEPEDHDAIDTYIREQRARWAQSRQFGDALTRIVVVTGRR